jgi:thiol:disulfide interchange protein
MQPHNQEMSFPHWNRVATLLSILFAVVIRSSPGAVAQSEFQVNRDLYSETADPIADIAAAVKAARPAHKRILLEFGGNWCADCQLLDYYYRQSPNAQLLAKWYVIVRVDIGHIDRNLEVASRYHVPVAKGVPALAILDSNGKLLYSEEPKEFEHSSATSITALLNRWKG